MNTQKYTQKTLEALRSAQTMAQERQNQYLTPEHLLLALLEHRAEQLGIGRFRWYTPAQLQAVIAESTALPEEPRRPLLRSRPLEAAEILAAALPLLG